MSTPDILETMRQRASWRNYSPVPLGNAARASLTEYFKVLPEPPFPAQWRFQLVEAAPEDRARARQLGTYGNIAGASSFVAGAIRAGEKDLENYGFLLENIILHATALGLGTCWLGGTFNRGGFGAALGVRADERMPAITPVGEVASQRGIRDRFLRRTANSENRRPWEDLFFSGDCATPLARERAGAYATPLDMVRLAPSASNKQPWRVLKEDAGPVFHFLMHRSRYPSLALGRALLGLDDLPRVDLGIAMCHFERAAEALGLSGRWAAAPPPVLDWPDRTEYVATWLGD